MRKAKLTVSKKILVGFSACLLVGAIGCQQAEANKESHASEGTSKPTQVQAEKKVQEETNKVEVTAPQLIEKYAANEVSADNSFKGKTLYVTGKVSEIKKDITDDIYVTLKGNEESLVRFNASSRMQKPQASCKRE